MYTKETICKEIRELAEGPVTMGRTEALAHFLYIKEHCRDLPGGEETDKAKLVEWVDHMENADGTTGEHWSRHEAEVLQAKYGIPCGELEFYVSLNMMYSDYCVAAAQAGGSTVELFARMAEAFFEGPGRPAGQAGAVLPVHCRPRVRTPAKKEEPYGYQRQRV